LRVGVGVGLRLDSSWPKVVEKSLRFQNRKSQISNIFG
jgi:hypothetical protein